MNHALVFSVFALQGLVQHALNTNAMHPTQFPLFGQVHATLPLVAIHQRKLTHAPLQILGGVVVIHQRALREIERGGNGIGG